MKRIWIGLFILALLSFVSIGVASNVYNWGNVDTNELLKYVFDTVNGHNHDGTNSRQVTSVGSLTSSAVDGKTLSAGVTALTPSQVVTVDPTLAGVFTLMPTTHTSINTAIPSRGQMITFVITTSGTGNYTVYFNSNFKSTTSLVTGATTAKKFTVNFISDGVNVNELSRTTAM